MPDHDALPGRLAAVRQQLAAAAHGVGRDPAMVTIIAVTKTLPPPVVEAVAAAGIADVGENYVQEADEKRARLSAAVRWHLIGGLQRNKVRTAARVFDCIHTIDRVELVRALASEATGRPCPLPVLIQVNVSGESAKRGASVEGAGAVVEAVLGTPHLRLDGLMTIGREGLPAATRAAFRTLRERRDDLARRCGVELPHLSMGMSDDFVIAIEEGATLVRLGRVLLGARGVRPWREEA